MNAEMKAQNLINTCLQSNPFEAEKSREIRDKMEAVNDIIALIQDDYDKHRGLVNEALDYFFTEEFTAQEIRTMKNDIRK